MQVSTPRATTLVTHDDVSLNTSVRNETGTQLVKQGTTKPWLRMLSSPKPTLEVKQGAAAARGPNVGSTREAYATFLDLQQEVAWEQPEVTSSPRLDPPMQHLSSDEHYMEDLCRRQVPVFLCFTYDRVGVFKHEALNTVCQHWRGWRMAKGVVPVADILDILDSFPMPDSWYNQLYCSKPERLVPKAPTWHCNQQTGVAGPTPMHREAVLNYY